MDMEREIDHTLWRCCAGNNVTIPMVGCKVWYFPQGHAEVATSLPDFTSLRDDRVVRCLVKSRVLSVKFLVNFATEEVFLKVGLLPIRDDDVNDDIVMGDGFDRDLDYVVCSGVGTTRGAVVSDGVFDRFGATGSGKRAGDGFPGGEAGQISGGGGGGGSDGEVRRYRTGDMLIGEARMVSFSKVLTPSDANNGGGFSVPRFCADKIFPQLDFLAVPPVQLLVVHDVLGVEWQFRHIYRGTPRRHLLTTGWSKFVNSKRLVSGDAVVFMRDNHSGQLFVGLRRRTKMSFGLAGQWVPQYEEGVRAEEDLGQFSRNNTGKVSPLSVLVATELAGTGQPFEVVYYPGTGVEFLVTDERFRDAMQYTHWTVGLRVKMRLENEETNRTTTYQGTVKSAQCPGSGMWFISPWRMLQVSWDDECIQQNYSRVNPWQIEAISNASPFQARFLTHKRPRTAQNLELSTNGQGPLSLRSTGNLNSSSFGYSSSPVDIQGTRQNPISLPSLSNSVTNSTQHMYYENHNGNNMMPVLTELNVGASSTGLNIGGASAALNIGVVSTELSIGSRSDNSSPHSQGSAHFFGNPELKASGSSFQLFGKVIHLNQPVEGGLQDSVSPQNAELHDGQSSQDTGLLDGGSADNIGLQKLSEVTGLQAGGPFEDGRMQDGGSADATMQDGASVEDGVSAEDAGMQDFASAKVTEMQDGALAEDAEMQDGAWAEDAGVQGSASVEDARRRDDPSAGDAGMQNGRSAEDGELQGGKSAKDSGIVYDVLAENAGIQNGGSTEDAELQGSKLAEVTELQDGVSAENSGIQDSGSAEDADWQGSKSVKITGMQDSGSAEDAKWQGIKLVKNAGMQDEGSAEDAELQGSKPAEVAELQNSRSAEDDDVVGLECESVMSLLELTLSPCNSMYNKLDMECPRLPSAEA